MNYKKSKGFTLIELLVVIAIISLLSSVILASIRDARQKAIDKKFITEIKSLQNALELYRSTNNTYPEMPVSYPTKPTTETLIQGYLTSYIQGSISAPRSQILSIQYWSKNMATSSGGPFSLSSAICLNDLKTGNFTPTTEELSKPYFILFEVSNNSAIDMKSIYNVGYIYTLLHGGPGAPYTRGTGYCVSL